MAESGSERQTHTKICLACQRGFVGDIHACPMDGATLVSLTQNVDPWPGRMLAARYRIEKRLAQGGVGIIYLAEDTRANQPVAIKMLESSQVFHDTSLQRFSRELNTVSSLEHEHIVAWRDSGIAPNGQPFLVMEYLHGCSLRDLLQAEGKMDPSRAVRIFVQVAQALDYAHKQGIVHRDLKPSNIFLIEKDGNPDFVKLVDFGLVKLMPWMGQSVQKLTKAGELFGSPIYVSPEQCTGRPIGPTSDIYSMGVVLFEALTGKPPFWGKNSAQTTSMHVHQVPPRFADISQNLDVPPALENAVMKALQKDPRDRFATMIEFSSALVESVTGVATAAAQPAPQLNDEAPETTGLTKLIPTWLRRLVGAEKR